MHDEKIAEFGKVWKGGYYEGDVANYAAPSSYKIYGYISVTRAVYITCLKPHITKDDVVLEIGPGRGAWTKAIADLEPRSIQAVDVVDADHSGFWNYVGRRDGVTYIKADDCSLHDIADDSVTYFFSFGVFCHLPAEMCEEYVAALAKKMRSGANGFLMIADFDKFNRCVANKEQTSLLASLSARRFLPTQMALRLSMALNKYKFDFPHMASGASADTQGKGSKLSHWYHWGVDRACAALETAGFEVIQRDMDQMPRDPMIHFRRR